MTTVLAVDIGGTKTILELAVLEDNSIHSLAESRFDSQQADSFDTILKEFLCQNNFHGRLDAACIGVAGPVDGKSAKVTNLPWILDADKLAELFNIGRVGLINDFQAIGFGIESLQANDLFVVQEGRPVKKGVRAIIGAGTGLGEAYLVWQGDRYCVYPSEGGHVDFAPTNPAQIELLRFLLNVYPQVSYERILSGPGLENIYWYVNSRQNKQHAKKLSAADITHLACEENEPNAVESLDMFLAIYGAQAGNLALTALASGGIYIAGGVAPRIKHKFLEGGFLAAFTNKCKMESLLQNFPVHIVDNPKVGLLGARNQAFHLAV